MNLCSISELTVQGRFQRTISSIGWWYTCWSYLFWRKRLLQVFSEGSKYNFEPQLYFEQRWNHHHLCHFSKYSILGTDILLSLRGIVHYMFSIIPRFYERRQKFWRPKNKSTWKPHHHHRPLFSESSRCMLPVAYWMSYSIYMAAIHPTSSTLFLLTSSSSSHVRSTWTEYLLS